MPELVRITDVSPRDGLQNEPGIIPTPEKIRLIELLAATGVDEIEATSFVSPKWVPQLGDAAEVLKGLLLPLPEGGGWGVGSRDHRPPKWSSPARSRLTQDRARALRNNTTGPEQELWSKLRQREWMGVKFRRQHPFGPFILDFFCVEKGLAIELDGRSHQGADAKQRDAERDAWIASYGVRTLRFSDDEAITNASGIAERVRDVARSMPSLIARKPTPQPPPSGRGSKAPIYSALVPNERGLQSALDANRAAGRALISKVSVFTAASETFSKKNTNATIAETLDRFRPVIATAHAEDLFVRGYVSCVVACPFEGPIAPARVVEVCEQLFDLGVDEIDLGDTIGAATPDSITALLDAYADALPLHHSSVPVTLHLHDTFGRAAECVRAALDFGIRSFDGAVAGLGGCPYASKTLPDGTTQRAPGNISTELLVRTIHAAGYETNVDFDKLAEAAAYAQDIVARSRAAAPKPGGAA